MEQNSFPERTDEFVDIDHKTFFVHRLLVWHLFRSTLSLCPELRNTPLELVNELRSFQVIYLTTHSFT